MRETPNFEKYMELSAQYGQLCVKSLITLNAAGLFAIPFRAVLTVGVEGIPNLPVCAMAFFVTGISLALLAGFLAYVNFQSFAHEELVKDYKRLAEGYRDGSDNPEYVEEMSKYINERANDERFHHRIVLATGRSSIGCGFASAICFVLGIIAFADIQ